MNWYSVRMLVDCPPELRASRARALARRLEREVVDVQPAPVDLAHQENPKSYLTRRSRIIDDVVFAFGRRR